MSFRFPRLQPLLLTALLLTAFLLTAWRPHAALAGGGPENLLLVVNPNSPSSMEIANHYVRLRDVPACNVLALPWDLAEETTPVDVFRDKILKLVVEAMRQRHLTTQIDYVVYSSDFPWGIDLKGDIKQFKSDSGGQLPTATQLNARGSINGLTYLWQPVLARDGAYVQLRSNRYMRLSDAQEQKAPTLGFRNTLRFGPQGELLKEGGSRYLLSAMLGVTTGRGNKVSEIAEYLHRSAAADGTHPRGTIYFARNDGIRSKVRHGAFPAAVATLNTLGVKAEIVEGVLPRSRDDVLGVMTGAAKFSWRASGSKILPGAICENFTSFGGVLRADWGHGQTPLSEFLRYGAAGSSGTVSEPYATQAKFPLATVHVHYARGCTLAESFYQSVYAPYQLLIVGDPLCRPWANIPKVVVEGVQPGATVQGTLKLKPSATFADDAKTSHFELFVDGWRRSVCRPGGVLELDTTTLADGYHELRVVAVEAGWIQSQGRLVLPIMADNHGRRIEATVSPPGDVPIGQPLVVTAESPGSAAIVVLHDSRVVGRIEGDSGQTTIHPSAVGFGPIRLQVVGMGRGGAADYVSAAPFQRIMQKH